MRKRQQKIIILLLSYVILYPFFSCIKVFKINLQILLQQVENYGLLYLNISVTKLIFFTLMINIGEKSCTCLKIFDTNSIVDLKPDFLQILYTFFLFLTLNLLYFLCGIIHLHFLELYIVSFMDIKMRT